MVYELIGKTQYPLIFGLHLSIYWLGGTFEKDPLVLYVLKSVDFFINFQKNPERPKLAKYGCQHGHQVTKMFAKIGKLVHKSPTWSPKIIPNWLYHQDFTKLSLNPHYSVQDGVACEYYNFNIK
ncbi:hypothetical protein TNCV_2259361 [Trichonephila clavipes]|nr:hypothetical protein TNCV_2259361 [Trichonephila clavipes]